MKILNKLETHFHLLLAAITIVGTLLCFWVSRLEILPTFYVSIVSLVIVYRSGLDSRNKLRLELYQARYKIYEGLIKYASATLVTATSNEDAVKAAHESFRGLPYHTTQFLFGEDIKQYFDEINSAFSYMVSHKEAPHDINQHQKWVKETYENLNKISNIVNEAPKLFYKYLYFGDVHRSDKE